MVERYRVEHGEYPMDKDTLQATGSGALPVDWTRKGKQEPVAIRRNGPGAIEVVLAWRDQVYEQGRGDDFVFDIHRPD